MILEQLALPGAFRLKAEPRGDARGLFARTHDAALLRAAGLVAEFPEWSLSRSAAVGTVRGLHWQAEPWAETKIIRCVAGRIFDVLVDLRRDSPAFGRWVAVELDAAGLDAVYAPAGLAHGLQTLTPDTDVLYAISEPYRPDAARGLRHDDPTLAIPWPLPPAALSDRDRALPGWAEAVGA